MFGSCLRPVVYIHHINNQIDKTDLMALGTILKLFVGIIGIIWSIALLIGGIIKKNNKRLKKAGLIFIGTFIGYSWSD